MPIRVIHQEPYTTCTGRQVALVRYEDPAAGSDWPREFWSWRDEGGRGPSLGLLRNRHQSRDGAIACLEAEERIRAATEGLPERLTRAEYEAACAQAGVEPLSDAQIRRRQYAILYGEFHVPEHTPELVIAMRLALLRMRALEGEQRSEGAGRGLNVDQDIVAPTGTTYTRWSYGTGNCRVCSQPESLWNPGAGRFLCDLHWDAY